MRYFLTGRLPKVNSILLVESGTRGLLEGLIGGLRQTWGDEIPIDLVTCYATYDGICADACLVTPRSNRGRRSRLSSGFRSDLW